MGGRDEMERLCEEFVAERAIGEKALDECAWLKRMVDDRTVQPVPWQTVEKHYVCGLMSPLQFRIGKNVLSDGSVGLVIACWCSSFAQNGTGNVNGGAISAMFDFGTALLGSFVYEFFAFGTTKAISVKFFKPVPSNECLRMEVTGTLDDKQGLGQVQGKLTNGVGDIKYATCTADMVDLPRRRKMKQLARL
uniref:Thioesterase domain-containing protein n=1 Tax=Mucochytrium quahogii TaxID=96639 RepID=A0A7S2WNU6_9STRA|mmetsp:Transcript_13981/g.22844  ORF Transcript_13981/g.22844 Transcript_13981/m.22844 type:complete len:192 (+) Transcript_13981:651-1226(+)